MRARHPWRTQADPRVPRGIGARLLRAGGTFASGVVAIALVAGCVTSTPASPSARPVSPSPEPTDLFTSTPDPGSQRDGLAPGFPSDVLPVPPGATVFLSFAKETSPGLWEISLNVRTTQDTAGLLEAVRGPLVAAGFTEQPAQPADGAELTAFGRGDGEVITVGIRDDGTFRTLTAGGTIIIQAAE